GDFIATGHYVRHQDPAADNASERPHRLTILKGKDQAKDQSYFLQAVPAERLAK
ncbi:MAG TPA: tRNA 2-thiouridine(34) synthase MnmA, partial [Gammaproteobacteria bacterium]|nr:tRNA 2-thiouridine(34) synthase MnmA [Gammaproteobacteria bacterium]